MKRCKHENAEHMMPGDSSTPDWCVQAYAEAEQFRCIDCGAWLSLGPSNDSIPRDEMLLAQCLADASLLYEPGAAAENARGVGAVKYAWYW